MILPPLVFGRYELWSDRIRAPQSNRRILIVDDYADIADSMGLLFQLEWFSTRTAYSGEQAVAIAQCWHPHIALLDISLPDFTGIEVARRLRTLLTLTDTVLIAHTALEVSHIREDAKLAGFDGFVGKPISPGHVVTLTNYLCPSLQALP